MHCIVRRINSNCENQIFSKSTIWGEKWSLIIWKFQTVHILISNKSWEKAFGVKSLSKVDGVRLRQIAGCRRATFARLPSRSVLEEALEILVMHLCNGISFFHLYSDVTSKGQPGFNERKWHNRLYGEKNWEKWPVFLSSVFPVFVLTSPILAWVSAVSHLHSTFLNTDAQIHCFLSLTYARLWVLSARCELLW